MDNLTDGNMSEAVNGTSIKVELYAVISMLSFLSVIGTSGNAVVLYVFSLKKDKQVSTLFIIVLALVDFITCLLVMPYTIYMEYVEFYVDSDVVCKVYHFLITSSIPFSAMTMVGIAVDRYFCICHPFLHALNIRRAKVAIMMLGLVACLLGVCVALMYGVFSLREIPGKEVSNITSGTIASLLDNGFDIADASIKANINASKLRFTGFCSPNHIILSQTFLIVYQKVYTALYVVCLVIVIVLYTLIYESVLSRRKKRQKQKSKTVLLIVQRSNERALDTSTEETQLTVVGEVNEDSQPTSPDVARNGSADAMTPANSLKSKHERKAKEKEMREKEKQRRKSMKKDRNRMANLKTAAMLFVVTVVFIVTFCPGFLMANGLIPYNMTVFYLYFANNVANPVIYSFMNKNFRDDLKKIFCRQKRVHH